MPSAPRTRLAMAHLDLGELELAETDLGRALEFSKRNGERPWEGWAKLGAGQLALRRGDRAAAELCFDEAQEIAEEMGMRPLLERCRAGLRQLRSELPPFPASRAYTLSEMDEGTFTRMAEEYAGRLYAVACRMLGNRADAEDAVQRALMKAYAARASYSPRWAVSTWLYRVLGNVCIDELRRRKPPLELAPDHGHRPARVERLDLERALAAVPREARLLLALHYVDGLSYRELARIRGISVNTVKSQLARGKAILRRRLED